MFINDEGEAQRGRWIFYATLIIEDSAKAGRVL
jgi:hypothetical protein